MDFTQDGKELLLALGALFCLCAGAMAADEITRARAANAFQEVFRRQKTFKERKKALKKVAGEYRNTVWYDDAMWCLTRCDLFAGNYEKMLDHARTLFKRTGTPALENFTRRTALYKNSRIPTVIWILEGRGHRYRRAENRKHHVLVFNVLPMTLRADMARASEKLGRPRDALKFYREAATLAPPGSLFEKSYRRQVNRLQKEVEDIKKPSTGSQAGDDETGKQGTEGKEKMARE